MSKKLFGSFPEDIRREVISNLPYKYVSVDKDSFEMSKDLYTKKMRFEILFEEFFKDRIYSRNILRDKDVCRFKEISADQKEYIISLIVKEFVEFVDIERVIFVLTIFRNDADTQIDIFSQYIILLINNFHIRLLLRIAKIVRFKLFVYSSISKSTFDNVNEIVALCIYRRISFTSKSLLINEEHVHLDEEEKELFEDYYNYLKQYFDSLTENENSVYLKLFNVKLNEFEKSINKESLDLSISFIDIKNIYKKYNAFYKENKITVSEEIIKELVEKNINRLQFDISKDVIMIGSICFLLNDEDKQFIKSLLTIISNGVTNQTTANTYVVKAKEVSKKFGIKHRLRLLAKENEFVSQEYENKSN